MMRVTGESLTCTGSNDPSTSVPFCYSDPDLGGTVDVQMDSFAIQAGTIDVTGSGFESISCLGKLFNKRFRSVSSSAVYAQMRSTPQWSNSSFIWISSSSALCVAQSA